MNDFLKQLICSAFANVTYPGNDRLVDSHEGEEPELVDREFKGKTDWRILDAEFLDQAPDGFSSALGFFSAAAFQFYLPAYLLADIDSLLVRADPLFYLCQGLDSHSFIDPVNPLRYGDQTWRDEASTRLSAFSQPQREAVAKYLRFKRRRSTGFDVEMIDQALNNYWDS